ncbi:MAG: tetratricopeptide repeat protein [Hyphomicrobiales bacterium]|nr:tetratricopeptide repeat protein [Hyphomicrobiales bacterium]
MAQPRSVADRVRALREKHEASAAEVLCQRGLTESPDDEELLAHLGMICLDLGREQEAVDHLERSVGPGNHRSAYRVDLARAYFAAGRIADGVDQCELWLSQNPGSPALQIQIAKLLQNYNCLSEAEECYRNAIQSLPRNAEARLNLGNCLSGLGRIEDAEMELRRAIAIRPEYAEAHNALGLLLLSLGRFEHAWEELEWRWQTRKLSNHERRFGHPRWNGEDLTTSRLLVWLEQGVGDEVFYAGILPDLVAAGFDCLVETDPRLVQLMRRSFPGTDFIARTDPPHGSARGSDISYEIAAGSLWGRFRRDRASLPAKPYLRADPGRTGQIDGRLSKQSKDRLKIGVSWYSANPRSGVRRSIPLVQWKSIFETQNCQFISLQYGGNSAEIAALREKHGIDILEDDTIDLWNDLDSVAALLSTLDLVISIDNSTVHMAGALGVPTWVLLASRHDARWLREGAECPWYAAVKLFRQEDFNDWSTVLETVASELGDLSDATKND